MWHRKCLIQKQERMRWTHSPFLGWDEPMSLFVLMAVFGLLHTVTWAHLSVCLLFVFFRCALCPSACCPSDGTQSRHPGQPPRRLSGRTRTPPWLPLSPCPTSSGYEIRRRKMRCPWPRSLALQRELRRPSLCCRGPPWSAPPWSIQVRSTLSVASAAATEWLELPHSEFARSELTHPDQRVARAGSR